VHRLLAHETVKAGVGAWSTAVTDIVFDEACPTASVTVSVTAYVPPPSGYLWLTATTLLADAPSPNVHARVTMPWSSLEPLPSKEHVSPEQVAESCATGG
jgi:hypothetical protein